MFRHAKTTENLKLKTKNYSKIALRIYLCVFITLLPFANEAIPNNENSMASAWDFALPTMQLNNVEINALSLQDAWKQISDDFLLRSVLVVYDNCLTNTPFSFKAAKCSGKDVLNAVTTSYHDFVWTQDSNTGVIWFHAKDLRLGNILSPKVRIANEDLGVPMQTGILEAIEDVPNGIRVKRWGTAFTNTFNYPVDLQAGEYSVRDVLNTCCIANPSKTFYIQVYRNREPQFTVISAVNLSSHKSTAPRPGILLFWTLKIGKLTESIPANEQIQAALANPDPRIRWAARMYSQAMALHVPFEELMNNSQSQEQALWVCLGAINAFVRSDEATYTDGIKKMQTVNKDFFENGDPNLAVLVAVELARLANDVTALNIVSQRKLRPGALASIKSEINYSARVSSKVRNALRITGTDWLAASDPSLKNLDKVPAKVSFIKSN
jgi:hypothetical protein